MHNRVIETGTNQGASSIVLAEAIKDSPGTGTLRTVELEQSNLDIAADSFAKAVPGGRNSPSLCSSANLS